MELSALSENIVPVKYKHGDDEVILQVNIDAFTPQFWRELRARAEEKFKTLESQIAEAVKEVNKPEVQGQKKAKKLTKTQQAKKVEEDLKQSMKAQLDGLERQALQLEAERETNIEFLIPHILKGWDVVDKGRPVALTREVLMPLPPKLIQQIFDVCVKAARTVKKTDDEEETLAATQDGSPSIRLVGQAT
jgi:hypothetical protein